MPVELDHLIVQSASGANHSKYFRASSSNGGGSGSLSLPLTTRSAEPSARRLREIGGNRRSRTAAAVAPAYHAVADAVARLEQGVPSE